MISIYLIHRRRHCNFSMCKPFFFITKLGPLREFLWTSCRRSLDICWIASVILLFKSSKVCGNGKVKTVSLYNPKEKWWKNEHSQRKNMGLWMTPLRFLRIWVERSQSERLLFNEWTPNQRALFFPLEIRWMVLIVLKCLTSCYFL